MLVKNKQDWGEVGRLKIGVNFFDKPHREEQLHIRICGRKIASRGWKEINPVTELLEIKLKKNRHNYFYLEI
jgi:hypothetical protein